MKLGVTGYGVVGKATAGVLQRLGHDVVVHDVSPERIDEAAARGFGPRSEAQDVDIDFLCVPQDHIEEAFALLPESGIAVIRSTVKPGTTDRLAGLFSRPCAYMPEFLREATAQWDALNPSFVLIGARDREHAVVLAGLFAPLMAQVVQVTPPVAEMVKLTLNAYLHTLISFWNEVHLICERLGLPSHLIGKLCAQDPRVPAYGATMHGDAVGGSCLPKDLAQLIAVANDLECSPDLLSAVQLVNEKLFAQPSRSFTPVGGLDGYAELSPRAGVVHLRW